MTRLPITLAIESSTIACSAALILPEGRLQRYQEQANIHSMQLLRMIDELLNEAGIDLGKVELLGVGVGPGSFTGLRIGVGVAQGLAYARQIPIAAVSSLRALAQSQVTHASPGDHFVCGLDARMNEMYWAAFQLRDDGRLQQIGDHYVCAPGQVSLHTGVAGKNIFVGNAWQVYQPLLAQDISEQLSEQAEISLLPQALHIAECAIAENESGSLADWRTLKPLYVRDDVAKKSQKSLL